jgi:hypothetical protein
MSEENPADYGYPKTELPVKALPDQPLKKDVKAGKVLTGDSETKLSTETPDPNVTSIGDITDTLTSGTVTGDANTTRSTTTRTSRSTSTTDGT